MKKFFSVISLQEGKSLYSNVYQAVGNQKLGMDRATRFPIMAAMNGYLEAGEEFSVVVVVQNNQSSRENYEKFKEELSAVSQARGAVCKQIQEVWVSEDQQVSAQAETFLKVIDLVNDGDELFCDMTYGTKPLSTVVLLAVQYGYRVKDATIECVVYGELKWWLTPKEYYIYDMTALLTLAEITRMLAERGVENPKDMIEEFLSQ